MFFCNDTKCKNISSKSKTSMWLKAFCEIYTEEVETQNTKNGPKAEVKTTILYKGKFGIYSRDYSVENGAFFGKTEIKVDVNPCQPLTSKINLSQDLSKLYIKIQNLHTPSYFDHIQVKRYDPNQYRGSIILIGNLRYAK
jgi:hypothetical protein